MRFLVIRLCLFLLPFVVYFIFLLLASDGSLRRLRTWLGPTIAGLVLVAASFVWLGLTEGWSTGGRYVPAHLANGRVVPGRVETTP